MFRNQYDTDVTTFSPAGRLHQVEYAVEAVKQGSTSVGVRSDRYAVVASLKRTSGELASYQQKVFTIDSHMGITISGLISDARLIAEYLRGECLNHQYVYGAPMWSARLVERLSDKSQEFTQKSSKRPYGVGLLIAAVDRGVPHLYATDPSGTYYEYRAHAIGARAQSSKTFLEKVAADIAAMDAADAIRTAIRALSAAAVKKLTSRNVSVGIVGVDKPFTILEGQNVREFVAAVTNANDEDEEEKEEATADEQETDNDTRAEEEEERAAKSAAEEQIRETQMNDA